MCLYSAESPHLTDWQIDRLTDKYNLLYWVIMFIFYSQSTVYQHFKNCKKSQKDVFPIFPCRIEKIFVPLHCENQNAHRLVADAGYFHSARMQSTLHSEIKKLQVEGQDEDVDDFPSTKVHRRCKKTKSPILLRSKPIVKPILQWALNGRTDYERQTFISLYCSYY